MKLRSCSYLGAGPSKVAISARNLAQISKLQEKCVYNVFAVETEIRTKTEYYVCGVSLDVFTPIMQTLLFNPREQQNGIQNVKFDICICAIRLYRPSYIRVTLPSR